MGSSGTTGSQTSCVRVPPLPRTPPVPRPRRARLPLFLRSQESERFSSTAQLRSSPWTKLGESHGCPSPQPPCPAPEPVLATVDRSPHRGRKDLSRPQVCARHAPALSSPEAARCTRNKPRPWNTGRKVPAAPRSASSPEPPHRGPPGPASGLLRTPTHPLPRHPSARPLNRSFLRPIPICLQSPPQTSSSGKLSLTLELRFCFIPHILEARKRPSLQSAWHQVRPTVTNGPHQPPRHVGHGAVICLLLDVPSGSQTLRGQKPRSRSLLSPWRLAPHLTHSRCSVNINGPNK